MKWVCILGNMPGLMPGIVIGISISLAVAACISTVLAIYCYYKHRRKVRMNLRFADGLPVETSLPYNLPAEAIMRLPPPAYTSHECLSSSPHNVHDNASDELIKPYFCNTEILAPPGYNVSTELSAIALPESPPAYTSQWDLAGCSTSFAELQFPYSNLNCNRESQKSFAVLSASQCSLENSQSEVDSREFYVSQDKLFFLLCKSSNEAGNICNESTSIISFSVNTV